MCKVFSLIETEKKIHVDFENLRILSGWSSCHIYARLNSSKRDLELWTALSNIWGKVSKPIVRINAKYALKGTESDRWLYKRFIEATNSSIDWASWNINQRMLAFTPEHFAYPDFYSGSHKLTTMAIGFDLECADGIKNLYAQQRIRANSLLHRQKHGRNPTGAGSRIEQIETFINELTYDCRIVFEYRRKSLIVSNDGKVQITEGYI